jgi:hypothetical protein
LDPNNQISAVIATLGAHQGSHLLDILIQGFNGMAIALADAGGPAYFFIKDVELSGGTNDSLPSSRIGIFTQMGSILELDTLSIEGATGHNVNIGVRVNNGTINARNLHFENTNDGVYFDTGGTNAYSVINGISGNATVATALIHIPAGYTGTVTALGINGLTGGAGQPVGILNANTGESYTNSMVGIYSWSGAPGVQTGSFAFSALHNTPHVRYGKNAAQVIMQNVLTLLTFPSQQDDWQTTASEWNGSRYTPKVPGRYRVSVSIGVASTAWTAGDRLMLQIQRTSVPFSLNEDDTATGTFIRQINLTDTVYCGAGDYIEAYVYQGVAAALNTDSSALTCFIAIDRE